MCSEALQRMMSPGVLSEEMEPVQFTWGDSHPTWLLSVVIVSEPENPTRTGLGPKNVGL